MSTSRRSFLAASAVAAASTTAGGVNAAAVPSSTKKSPFTYCLNTGTIRGQTEDITEHIRIASEAGYDGIEPWSRHIDDFTASGRKLTELRQMIDDAGLTVDSAIGFANWIVDDEAARKKGLEQAKRDMDALAAIGGTRIAAPPVGGHRTDKKIDPFVIAERYHDLLVVGDETGVVPQLEVWGFSTNLSRLGESTMVCVEANHPKACLLPDVYHIFRGGSGFGGLDLLHNSAIHVFHMNDYPATPAREELNDSHRVYPGDGIAPLDQILHAIGGNGRSVALSLELFNRDYWKQDALEVAKTGLAKMKAAVQSAEATAIHK